MIDVVSNKVDRKSHYFYISEITKNEEVTLLLEKLLVKPVQLAEYLVKFYPIFLKEKMMMSTDQVLKFVINFSIMSVKYRTMRNAVRKGDSVMVESFYQWLFYTDMDSIVENNLFQYCIGSDRQAI